MKHFTFLLSFLGLALLTISCGDGEAETRSDCVEHVVSDCNEDASGVNVRIRNATGLDMCNLELNWGQYNLGELFDGEETCYYSQDVAYRYPSAYQFYVDDVLWGAEAIDFTGEAPLDPGYYTYEIFVIDEADRSTSINFFED